MQNETKNALMIAIAIITAIIAIPAIYLHNMVNGTYATNRLAMNRLNESQEANQIVIRRLSQMGDMPKIIKANDAYRNAIKNTKPETIQNILAKGGASNIRLDGNDENLKLEYTTTRFGIAGKLIQTLQETFQEIQIEQVIIRNAGTRQEEDKTVTNVKIRLPNLPSQ